MQDETILPEDYKRAGIILDDEMNRIMVKHLPPGVRLTAVFDCCHSGSALDLPFMYHPDGRLIETTKKNQITGAAKQAVSHLTRGNIFGALNAAVQGLNSASVTPLTTQQKEQQRGNRFADVVMFSGCKDKQTSADAYIQGQSTGAMSFALIKALKATPHCSYGQLLQSIRIILQNEFHQVPQLSSGRYMDMNQQFIF
jgi:metacaspase-1